MKLFEVFVLIGLTAILFTGITGRTNPESDKTTSSVVLVDMKSSPPRRLRTELEIRDAIADSGGTLLEAMPESSFEKLLKSFTR